MNEFELEVHERVLANSDNDTLISTANAFLDETLRAKYAYNFSWLSRPIIQYPQDIVAFQELVWRVKPSLIIETGIAHGGSLILSASLLALLDLAESIDDGTPYDAKNSQRCVIGIDIELRAHNLNEIKKHPLSHYITIIQGSSTEGATVDQVRRELSRFERVMVVLDSNHTHSHVLSELELYGPMTSIGSYCLVFDTIIETNPAACLPDRPWGPGNSPLTAVQSFLARHPEFESDHAIHNKLMISAAPNGYLKRIS